MKANIGTIDKIFRIAVGTAMIGAGVYFGSWWGAIGIIPIGTAIFGVCPAYLPIGLSTCKTTEPPK